MKQERGFALLLVFVLAAAIALLLYKELPRVAFEGQRDKEALLIARGEGYQRAIQLYVRKFKKYPVKIEDLENTNRIRFLRKRYDDPMTGKSEWRMIHIGAGGLFTDSLTHKPPGQDKDKEKKAANTFTYEAPSLGSTPQDAAQNTPSFAQMRPSERAGLPMLPQSQPQQQSGQPGDPSNPQQQQPVAGFVAGNPNQNPNQQPAYGPPGVPGVPGLPPGINPQQLGQQQQANGQFQAGTYPGSAVNSQTGGLSQQFPYSTQPGAQGSTSPFGQPGMTTTPNGQPGQPNQALNLINQILTTPRPGPGAVSQPMAGMQIAPGIAGVASTLERKGIKVYNEKEKYNEWEFIYDLTKDTAGTAMTTGISGAPQSQQPGQGQQSTGTSSPFGSSAFGASSPAGNSPFGSSPFGSSPNNPSPFGQPPQPPPQPPLQIQQPQPQPQPQITNP